MAVVDAIALFGTVLWSVVGPDTTRKTIDVTSIDLSKKEAENTPPAGNVVKCLTNK